MKCEEIQKQADGPDIIWSELRHAIRGVLVKRTSPIQVSDLDDLVQETSLKIFWKSTRETINRPMGLAVDIAFKVAADALRKRKIKKKFLQLPSDDPRCENAQANTPSPDVMRDPHLRISFVILEFFKEEDNKCAELALHNLNDLDWVEVAERIGMTPGAVRAKWFRCMKEIKKNLHKDPGLKRLLDLACA